MQQDTIQHFSELIHQSILNSIQQHLCDKMYTYIFNISLIIIAAHPAHVIKII